MNINFLSFFFVEFLDPNVVELYLKYNPQFLDDFIKANIQRVQIARWLDMKSRPEDNIGLMSGPQSKLLFAFMLDEVSKKCTVLEENATVI